MGDEPVHVATTLKACREALKTSSQIQLNVKLSNNDNVLVEPGALNTRKEETNLLMIGFLVLLAGCALYALLIVL